MSHVDEYLKNLRARAASPAAEADEEILRARAESKRREARALEHGRLAPYRGMLPVHDYERLIGHRLDSPAWKTIVEPGYQAFLRGDMRFLWITSGPGTGKTVASLRPLMLEGGALLSIVEVDRAYSHETDEAKRLRQVIETARVLVIDDVGTMGTPKDEYVGVYTPINRRQGEGRFTILTSNLTRKEVEGYGPRILSRIEQQGAIVEFSAPDMRRVR